MVKLYAVISQTSPRYQDWLFVLGSDHAPIESPNPVRGTAPGVGERLFYKLDYGRLVDDQLRRLIQRMSEKWGMEPGAVVHDMFRPDHGIPILADDVTIVVDQRMEV